MATNGLLSKINLLFNNPKYSDIQFDFMYENGTSEKMFCHKLILALQSKVFSHMFFEEEISPSVIRMQASRKQLFCHLFKFIYTGDVSFHSFEEAHNLLELASDYLVEELEKKCHNYILEGSLTIENIFFRYEQSLKLELEVLLTECRNFVCSNVGMVLKSNEFTNASFEVIKDIIKLDNLPLTTELEIIEAILKWGSENLRRNKIPCNEKNLRKSIDPFLKYLRILSLTSSEFQYLVTNYDIFSAYESMTLTQEIMMPQSSNNFPENFCFITTKRRATVLNRNNSAECIQYKSVKSSSPKSVRSDPPKSLISVNNEIRYEVRKKQIKKTSVSSPFHKKFNSTPNIITTEFQTPSFSQNLLRNFQFPLKETEKSFTLSFRKDIKCSVNVKMKSGNLSLHGFELKVKNKSAEKEKIEIYVYLRGFTKNCFEKLYNLDLQNDVLSVTFPKPKKLQEGSKGVLEVCIENLLLDRCSQISKKQYNLNSGLNFECEFCIESNKRAESDEHFLFLINKLIYVPF